MKYIPVDFRDVETGPICDKIDLLKGFVTDCGFDHIYRKDFKNGILYIELKQDILAVNKIFEYVPAEERTICLHDITDRGISIWFFLGQEGDEIVFIPFDNIACITGRNYEDGNWAKVNYFCSI